MTKTVDVAANEKIASTWGNEIRDRTIQVFSSAAERDAQWPTAPNGSYCTLADGTLWRRTAGAWRQALTLLAGATAQSGDMNFTVLGFHDVVTVNPPAQPTPSFVVVHGVCYFGFSTAAVNANADLYRFIDAGTIATPGPTQAGAGAWVGLPVYYSWNVAAGADPSFKLRVNFLNFTGNAHALGHLEWQIFA